MAITSSIGLGSGLDIGSLVSQLVAAEGQSKSFRLDQREANLQARLSALGTFKSALSDFQSSLGALTKAATFEAIKAKSSDSKQFTASAVTGAVTGSYSVEVSSLAEAHTLSTSAANAKTNITDTVGTGTLTFTFGDGTTKTVSVTDGSLASVRDSINDANIGVSASLINDGTGYRLTLKSATGLDKEMTITVADDDGNNLDDAGLSILAFDAAGTLGNGKNLDQTNAASDAVIVVDGITVTNSSNTVTGVIDDVTLELTGISSGSAATLTISQDTSGAKTAINDFKEAFNSMAKALNDLTYYDEDSGQKGIFLGAAIVRNAEYAMHRILNQTIGSSTNTTYNSLAMLGFKTKRDGTYEVDSSMLNKALSGGIDEVKALFAGGLVGATTVAADLVASYAGVPTGVNSADLNVEITQQATKGYYAATIAGVFSPSNANQDNFTLSIDGVTTNQINLTRTTYDPTVPADMTSLVSQIQTALDTDPNLIGAGKSATVSFDSVTNELRISSNSFGSTSTVSVVSTATNLPANLGLTVGAGTSGLDVAGTVDGTTGTGSGQVLSITTGTLAGLDVTVTSGTYSQDQTTGGRTEKGVMGALNELLEGYLDFDGVIQSSTDSYNSQIEKINEDRAALGRRLASLESRLLAQYSAMDALVGQLNATGNYLSSQLANLPSLTSRRK